MYNQAKWGTVNLGQDTLQGHGEQSQPGFIDYQNNHQHSTNKQQYNPGRNQELNLNPSDFSMHKKTDSFSIHEKIKGLLADGHSRRDAVKIAKDMAKRMGKNDGSLTKKQVYAQKYQAEQPGKYVTPFHIQEQSFPFI